MRKLGLCVRYDCDNYGSMLQILATQKVIKMLGWDYEIIRYDKKTLGFLIKNVTRIFNPYFMRGKLMQFSKKRKMRAHPDVRDKNRERLQIFREYRKEYIGPYSPVYKGYSNLQNGAGNYDAVMVGSDQLWTPAGIKSKFYNLIFVPDNIKKVSFATSFGVSEVPKSQLKMTKYYLNRIEHISVREIAGAKMVKDLTGKEAMVALDPTLMLSGKEWEEVFPTEKMSEEPYIFAYFLGTNSEHRRAVTKLAKESGLKIITCPHLDEFVAGDLDFGDEQRYNVSPVDFLNLIRGAEFICTDSFHGSVFSILNHKQFLTFDRFKEGEKQSRNSRIKSLFELLKLEERHCMGNEEKLLEKVHQPIDYAKTEEELTKLRAASFEFLKNALEA